MKAKTSHPLTAALIGISGFGAVHLKQLRRLQAEGAINLVAATVVNRPEVEEECAQLEAEGIQIDTDYETMLDRLTGKLDLVCIPTGIAWHEPMTLRALEAGAHVYLEKPAAGTCAEIDRMIAARDRAKRQVAVGFQILFSDTVREAKRRLLAGAIGPIREIAVSGCWPRKESYYERNGWAGRIESGGRKVLDSPANNALSHFLIAGLFLAASTQDAVAELTEFQAWPYRAKPIKNFDTLSLLGTTQNGVRFGYHVTHSCIDQHPPTIAVRGEHGDAVWTPGDGFQFPNEAEPIGVGEGNMQLLSLSFGKTIAAIRNNQPPPCTLEMARRHTEIIEGIHEHFPVIDFPAERVQDLELEDGDRLRHVPGIEAAIEQAFQEHWSFTDFP